MRPQKEPPKASDSFYCADCDQTFDGTTSFKEHLTAVHGVTDFKGATGKMRMHLDSADSYMSEYECTIAGLSFVKTSVRPRKGFWQGEPR